MPDSVRVGVGQAFWGDDITVPRWQVESGSLDYLVMDFLAELTMSILQRQRARDPRRGYATDVIPILRDTLAAAVQHGTRLIMNAGGVNPHACGAAVSELVAQLGLKDHVRVAVVVGDDLLDRLDDVHTRNPLQNMDTDAPFEEIADRVTSANVYLGAAPIVEALSQGATVVITGRCTDTALTLGPLIHEFGWAATDYDLLAAGVVAGHMVECGAQATGGNHHAGWWKVPGLARVGYPIVEVFRDGRIEFSKTPSSGGLVDRETTIEQLIFEIEDPHRFLTPDVTVDWTSFVVREIGVGLVEIAGVRGCPPPESLKASITFHDGFMTSLLWTYAAPDAVAKARAAGAIIQAKIDRLGLTLDATRADVFGCGAIHGPGKVPAATGAPEPQEVILRFAARSRDERSIRRLSMEVAPMHFGPASLAGYIGGGRGHVSEILAQWPALVDRGEVNPQVVVI
jgi:hypothetical protein